MFPPFPDFEEQPIFLEINWHGRTQRLKVCIEELPCEPSQAVPVVTFLDRPDWGEWLMAAGKYDIYTLGNPYHLLRVRSVFCGIGEELGERVEINPHRVERLRGVVERAINATKGGIRLLRVTQLLEMPSPPQIAMVSERGGFWCSAWKSPTATPFDALDFDLYQDGNQIQQWVQSRWEQTDSDVHFSWQWANWNEEERLRHSCGWTGAQNQQREIEEIMKWALLSTSRLWQISSSWTWELNPHEGHGGLSNAQTWDAGRHLEHWQFWLWLYFFPNWRTEWLSQHRCVFDYWEHLPLAQIEINQPPTMHEQLEARLGLRSWLEGKATPEEIETLVSEL